MPQVGERIENHANFRFTVKVNDMNIAAFTECVLPNLQVETVDVKEGGQNEYIHRLPVRVKVGTIKLRRGLTRGNDLLNWYMEVMRGELEKATREVHIDMYDSKLKEIASWTFYRVFPVKWTGPTLKAGEDAIAIEELELAHHGFEINRR